MNFSPRITQITLIFYFFRVNSRYSRLILTRPCEIPKSLAVEKCRLRVDYGLLAIFVLFFGLTDNIQFLFATMLAHPHHVFLLSSSLSQIISNVPAALLLADFTPHWQALLWGVSVGGFGSMVGSLANLITYRLYQKQESTEQHFVWKFHAMSYVAFFAGWLLYGVYFRLAG